MSRAGTRARARVHTELNTLEQRCAERPPCLLINLRTEPGGMRARTRACRTLPWDQLYTGWVYPGRYGEAYTGCREAYTGCREAYTSFLGRPRDLCAETSFLSLGRPLLASFPLPREASFWLLLASFLLPREASFGLFLASFPLLSPGPPRPPCVHASLAARAVGRHVPGWWVYPGCVGRRVYPREEGYLSAQRPLGLLKEKKETSAQRPRGLLKGERRYLCAEASGPP